jgi:hypothetical protein
LSEEFFYKKIKESEVEPEKVREAERVLCYCSKVLDLPEIKIQWIKKVNEEDGKIDDLFKRKLELLNRLRGDNFSKEETIYHKSNKEFWGQFDWCPGKDDFILVLADPGIDHIKIVVAHECKHVHDFGPRGRYRVPITQEEKDFAEKSAEEFAQKVVREIR